MLTTSRIAKAIQVSSLNAFAVVQAMMATTSKIAIEKIATRTNFLLTASEVNISLRQAKKPKGNISEISEIQMFSTKGCYSKKRVYK